MSDNLLPLTSFLRQYAESKPFRGHMPGHHGRGLPGFPALSAVAPYDITEIAGADSLFEAVGILLQSEALTAAQYGSGGVCWSAGGSTLCIQAMLAQMKAEGRTVIAGRTVHRSFLNSCLLLGLEIRWVFPEDGSLLSGRYRLEDFAAALSRSLAEGERPCVYVTSPDYLGGMQDIASLAEVCGRYGAPLLVDNAHGAHLGALGRHPAALGADYCCDSAHKLLPALTGGAWLHCKEAQKKPLLKQHMQLFGSTSPSYLIMQSLEASTAWLREGGAERIRWCAERAMQLREALPFRFLGEEPLHLSIAADGLNMAKQLRRHGLECEYADRTCLVILLSPLMEEDDFRQLEALLRRCPPEESAPPPPLPAPMEQALPMREAALAAWEVVPLRKAEGRICGPVQVPCPPAVPIAVSGERLSGDWLRLMAFYGLEEVAVVC